MLPQFQDMWRGDSMDAADASDGSSANRKGALGARYNNLIRH